MDPTPEARAAQTLIRRPANCFPELSKHTFWDRCDVNISSIESWDEGVLDNVPRVRVVPLHRWNPMTQKLIFMEGVIEVRRRQHFSETRIVGVNR